MIKQLFKMPRQPFVLACSGGSDSMAAADFYRRGGHDFALAYFDHGTPTSAPSRDVVRAYGALHGIEVVEGSLTRSKEHRESLEAFWRDERYAFLRSLGKTIVTCHHIDDVVETWVFTSLHGAPKLVPARNGDVVRPFLLNDKSVLTQWCVRNGVRWHEDASNRDVSRPRNRIRHNVLPELERINPGVRKVLRRMLTDREDSASLIG